MTVNPLLASQVQNMAAHERNEKIALAMSVTSAILLAVVAWKEISHCMKEQFRDHDREYDRRHRDDHRR